MSRDKGLRRAVGPETLRGRGRDPRAPEPLGPAQTRHLATRGDRYLSTSQERSRKRPDADDEVEDVVRGAFEVGNAERVRRGVPRDHEAVDREEERGDSDDRDEPLLQHGVRAEERRRDGDDYEAGVSDI